MTDNMVYKLADLKENAKDPETIKELDRESTSLQSKNYKVLAIRILSRYAHSPTGKWAEGNAHEDESLTKARDYLKRSIELAPDPESYVLLTRTLENMIQFSKDNALEAAASEQTEKDLIRSATGYCEALKHIGVSDLDPDDMEYLRDFCRKFTIPVIFPEKDTEKKKKESPALCIVTCVPDVKTDRCPE